MLEAAKQLLMSEDSERREIAEFEEGKKNPQKQKLMEPFVGIFPDRLSLKFSL